MTAPVFEKDPIGWLLYWIHWLMATLGMGWQAAWDFWFKVNPATGMTEAGMVSYLEQNQDPHERELQAKTEKAAELTQQEREKKAKDRAEQDAMHDAAVKKVKDDYAKLDDKEKARVMDQQDKLEQDRQAKANRAAAIKPPKGSKASVEKPADHQASLNQAASTAQNSASPTLAPAKPQAYPGYTEERRE